MPNAELRQQRVNCADLDSPTTAVVAKFRGFDVIAPIGDEKSQRTEVFENRFAVLRSGEALEQFLQHKARGENRFSRFKGITESAYLGVGRWTVASERERPYTCVDEQAQSRFRSAL